MSGTVCVLDEPESIQEATRILAELNGQARPIAGGTDLYVEIKSGLFHPVRLVSLLKIKELSRIEETEKGLRLGAGLTAAALAGDPHVKKRLPALSDAAFSMASYQIRNMATLGGNLCSAVPSADLAPPLIAAEASIELRNSKGVRTVPLEQFFTGPRKTVLGRDELATHIIIPTQPSSCGSSYRKFKMREANALATAAVAARLVLHGGKIAASRLVLGAVAPIPMLATEAMKELDGKAPSKQVFEQAAERTYTECRPISDVRCCADFRRDLIRTLTVRALHEAFERAGGKKS